MVTADKRVKDIMSRIEEYETVDSDSPLCDILGILNKNQEKIKSGEPGKYHKTFLVTDKSKTIIGKLSFFDLIRGLVPEPARKVELSKSFTSVLSSRALEVAGQVGEMQSQFKWLHSSFQDLVKQEAHKKVKDIMSPIHPLLEEDDTINKAIFIMFRENIRQPLVVKDGKIVGVISLMDIFPNLLKIAGDECFLPPDK